MARLFAGLEDIEWHAMEHAYGPATDVPDLLRELVAADPAVRETALAGMYTAVHHQGDVHECTIASIPFLLEAVAHPELLGRAGIVELLASIGGADDDADGAEPDDEGVHWAYYRRASNAVAAAYPTFLELLADADPAVRRAAATILPLCRAEATRVVTALQERLLLETDGDVQNALVTAIGSLGRRAANGSLDGVDVAALGDSLAALVASTAEPALRLVALGELARCAPAALPTEPVPTILELLAQVYADDAPAPDSAGFSTNTLLGALRELAEREAAGRRAPNAAGLVREVSAALMDRVDERVQMLTTLLHAPDWECRYDAITPAHVLIGGWRGTFEEMIFLIGEQLLDPQPRLRALAADSLKDLDELAAPAADALARSLDTAPRQITYSGLRHPPGWPSWIVLWTEDRTGIGPALRALASLGDVRALPMLRWALEQDTIPRDIANVVGALGADAAELVPLIRQRLRDRVAVRGYDGTSFDLVMALRGIGEAASPAVPDLLALAPDPAVLYTLGELGPAAAEAVPVLRPLLDHAAPLTALAAAWALWGIEGDPALVLPVFARHLDGDQHTACSATGGLAALGAVAAMQAPRLRALLDRPDLYGWMRVQAAEALWRTTSDTQATLPALVAAWTTDPATRLSIAKCLAQMGPPAEPATPLLRTELVERRRCRARLHGGEGSDDIAADQALVRACSAALTAITRA